MKISRRSFLGYLLSSSLAYVGDYFLPRRRSSSAPLMPPTGRGGHISTPASLLEPVVAITQCPSYDYPLVESKVRELVDLLGGLGHIIGEGSRVTLKVNVCAYEDFQGAPAEECYVTHPYVVKALGKIVLEQGASELFIVEGPTSASIDTMAAFQATGYSEVAADLSAHLVDLNHVDPFHKFSVIPVPGGGAIYDWFRVNGILEYADVFISIAKLKCHQCAGVTLSLKNQVGCLPAVLYSDDPLKGRLKFVHGINPSFRVPRVILDINRANPIRFTLVDGISSMDVGQGPQVPGANRTFPGVLIGGFNPVATDAVATAVMGFDPTAEKPQTPFHNADNHLNLAREAGLGTNRLEDIEIRGTPIDEVLYPYNPPPRRYDIALLNPPNGAVLSSAPTFEWTPLDSNTFKIQFLRENGKLIFDTWEDGHLWIYDPWWALPDEWWSKVPAGVPIYWRVGGFDQGNEGDGGHQSETWFFSKR